MPEHRRSERNRTGDDRGVGRLTQKDIEILHTLYRLRAMSSRHISDAFYSHIVNARKRIRQFREMGWIAKYPYRRLMYHITERGLSLLSKHASVLPEDRINRIKISRSRMQVYEHFVDLAVATYRHGWDFLDSRAAKVALSLPEASHLQGVLITPDKKWFPVLVLGAKSTRRTIYNVLRTAHKIDSAFHPSVAGIIITIAGENPYHQIFEIPDVAFTLPVHLLPSAYARRAVPCLLPFSEHSHKYGLVPAGEEGCPYRAGGRCVTELLTLTHTNLIRLRYGTPAGEVWAAEELIPLIRAVTGKTPDRVVKIPCASSP